MNRSKRIINKILVIISALILAGCETTTPDWGKYRGKNPHPHVRINNERITMEYLNSHPGVIENEAELLDMSVVSYLHAVSYTHLTLPTNREV